MLVYDTFRFPPDTLRKRTRAGGGAFSPVIYTGCTLSDKAQGAVEHFRSVIAGECRQICAVQMRGIRCLHRNEAADDALSIPVDKTEDGEEGGDTDNDEGSFFRCPATL